MAVSCANVVRVYSIAIASLSVSSVMGVTMNSVRRRRS
jgi:hypothetical protein